MVVQDLRSVAFPKLDRDEIAHVAHYLKATLERYRDGDVLVRAGACESRFFIIASGELAVLDEVGDEPRTIAVLGPGEFTGEVAGLNGASSLVTIVARGACEVYAVSTTSLRQLINRAPTLGDRILQAFIARRQILGEPETFVGLRLVGSRHSKDTSRVRDFLVENQIPFVALDLEDDPAVNKLLAEVGVTEAERPIVALGRKLVLRNPSSTALAAALGIRPPLESEVYSADARSGSTAVAAAVGEGAMPVHFFHEYLKGT